ncbi:MAG TPA: zf-HC2 domain-containing protein, partial [Gemmatimonadaceae bacterium]|nr:zf-HC2 domain-containing protein [Gemmatimonadaceae bacterium]
MSHPDEGLIHAWLDGELDAAEAARVEALVRDDPGWAAAAAEARGLIAASGRIVGALDDVPANVVPKASGETPAAPLNASTRGAMP